MKDTLTMMAHETMDTPEFGNSKLVHEILNLCDQLIARKVVKNPTEFGRDLLGMSESYVRTMRIQQTVSFRVAMRLMNVLYDHGLTTEAKRLHRIILHEADRKR